MFNNKTTITDIAETPSFCEKSAFAAVLFQIALITWGCSGTSTTTLLAMLWTAVVAAGFAVLSGNTPRTLFYRAVLWGGIAFCAMCLIQLANPSFDFVTEERIYKLVPRECFAYLPTSVSAEFSRGNALSSLSAISAVWLTLVAAGTVLRRSFFAKASLLFFAANCTAMGVWAITQKLLDFPAMYGSLYAASGFYGTFFLSNAAAAFLNLGLGASLAFALSGGRGLPAVFLKVFALLCAAICAAASVYSESVGGAAMCAATLALFCTVAIFKKCGRFAGTAAMIVILSIAGAAFFCSDIKIPKCADESISSRTRIYEASAKVLEISPFWGVGGDCCQYFLGSKMAENRRDIKDSLATVAEHAHSDILEYAVDFGLAGLAVLLLCAAIWGFAFFDGNFLCSAPNAMMFFTTLLCFAHSCIDIHLHIPSTMIAFALCAAWTLAPLRGEEDGND